MNVIRKIFDKMPETIQVPDSLIDRKVEMILLPIDQDESNAVSENQDTLNQDVQDVQHIIGAWKGEPLTRPKQGSFDIREPLQ